jgi:uncharacterized protein YqgC (DUF456 family)
MDLAIILILGIIVLAAGLVFSVLPPLPGPPIAYIALLSLAWYSGVEGPSTYFLVLWAVLAVASTFMDNILTVWGTKLGGGSKSGVWGSFIGLILGMLFFPPFGILIGPFLGAMCFEIASGKDFNTGIKAGLGSFVGFLAGTLLKVGISIGITYHWIRLLITGA